MRLGENLRTVNQLDGLKIERPAFSQKNINDIYDYEKPKKSKVKEFIHNKRTFTVSKWARQTFPVLDWIPRYNWKVDFPCDVIAGITVGIMHIPQGLGYALLANVPPVVGIYMAFFPMIPYFFLGTSRHNSMGTFAVICLLVGKAVTTYSQNPAYTHLVEREINGSVELSQEMFTEMEIGTAVTFYSGIWQLVMYACQMGVVCTLLSDALVSSFITGAGVHIFTSQIKEVLGVNVTKFKGPLYIVYTYNDMFDKIINSTPETRVTMYTAMIVSAIAMALLLVTMFVIRPWLEKFTKIPFPAELILIIAGVLASVNLQLPQNYGLKPIGYIPTGLPGPETPDVSLFSMLAVDSFVTAVVAYAVSMSMALILAEGEDYEVDPNQELLAQGIGNLVNSFFSCVTFGASLSRSMVLRGVGGRTQFTGLIASGLIVIILLWIADLFQPLPRAILASIIIIALKKIFAQLWDLPVFWRRSKLDGIIWVIVFISVIVIDVDYGLLIGFCLSVGAVFMQGLKAYTCLLGHIPNTDLYLDVNRYKTAQEINGIKIMHYQGGLNFATRQHLKREVIRLTDIDPKREIRKRDKLAKKMEKKLESGTVNLAYIGDATETEAPSPANDVFCIILDFSAVSSIDPAGADQVKSIKEEYKSIDIALYVAGCSGPVYEKMQKCGHLEGDDPVSVFPTVYDAVHHARNVENVRL